MLKIKNLFKVFNFLSNKNIGFTIYKKFRILKEICEIKVMEREKTDYVLKCILEAFKVCSNLGIIHRDIKP